MSSYIKPFIKCQQPNIVHWKTNTLIVEAFLLKFTIFSLLKTFFDHGRNIGAIDTTAASLDTHTHVKIENNESMLHLHPLQEIDHVP